jgi:hypothetical protein
MIDRNEANEWIERLMDGEEIPPEMEEFIRQTPECREYQAALERAVSALDSLNIPEPPAGLSGDVMRFIAEREEAETRATAEIRTRRSIWFDIGAAVLNLLPEMQVPIILQREAFPAFLSVCVVLFGVFISPQVQAGKDSRLLEQFNSCADWMAQNSDRISDGIYSKANGLIDQVTEAFQRSNNKAANQDATDANPDVKNAHPPYTENASPVSVESATEKISVN